jgi:hypothetical protein
MFKKLGALIPRRRSSAAAPLDLRVPKFTIVEEPRSVTGYVLAALVALGALSSLLYFGTTAPTAPPPPVPAPMSVDGHSPVAPQQNSHLKKAVDGCCEWVDSSTRSDGTHVEGYWRSKPGCADGCSLAAKPPESVVSEKPAVHVGPRAGRYHYSKNGTKVYEHRKQ